MELNIVHGALWGSEASQLQFVITGIIVEGDEKALLANFLPLALGFGLLFPLCKVSLHEGASNCPSLSLSQWYRNFCLSVLAASPLPCHTVS